MDDTFQAVVIFKDGLEMIIRFPNWVEDSTMTGRPEVMENVEVFLDHKANKKYPVYREAVNG